MATLPHHLGRTAFRWRWCVTLLWAAVPGAVGFAAAKAPAAPDDGFTMPAIVSQKAFDLLKQRFPGTAADGANARTVFVAPPGGQVTATGNRTATEKLVTDASDGSQVASAVDPLRSGTVSADASTAYSTLTFEAKADDLTGAAKTHLRRAVDTAREAGPTVEVGGNAQAAGPAAGGSAEAIGIAAAGHFPGWTRELSDQ